MLASNTSGGNTDLSLCKVRHQMLEKLKEISIVMNSPEGNICKEYRYLQYNGGSYSRKPLLEKQNSF